MEWTRGRREQVKKLISLYKLTQEQLAKKIIYTARKYNFNVITDNKNYIIVNKDAKIVLSSHLDIVHKIPPSKIKIYDNGIIKANNKILGGDDRNGVFIMLELIKSQIKDYCYIFFYNEEIGCKGSNHLVDKQIIDLNSYNCFIGLDRRGVNDLALYDFDNKELIKIFKNYGYVQANGSITDVSVLSGNSEIACINLSVGFFNEHTTNEYTYFPVIESTLNILQNSDLIEKLSSKQFKYEFTYTYYNNFYSNYYKKFTRR